MPEPIEIGDQAYRLERKLNGLKQLHVSRKLTPLLTHLASLAGSASGTAEILSRSLTDFAPVAQALAAMPEDDVNYIVGTCLECVTRREAGGVGWLPVWNTAVQQPQYDDIDMMVMLRLTWAVVMDNMRGFIPAGVLNGLPGVAKTSPASMR